MKNNELLWKDLKQKKSFKDIVKKYRKILKIPPEGFKNSNDSKFHAFLKTKPKSSNGTVIISEYFLYTEEVRTLMPFPETFIKG